MGVRMLGCVLSANLTFQETSSYFLAAESLLILTNRGSLNPEVPGQTSKSAIFQPFARQV